MSYRPNVHLPLFITLWPLDYIWENTARFRNYCTTINKVLVSVGVVSSYSQFVNFVKDSKTQRSMRKLCQNFRLYWPSYPLNKVFIVIFSQFSSPAAKQTDLDIRSIWDFTSFTENTSYVNLKTAFCRLLSVEEFFYKGRGVKQGFSTLITPPPL